jgi:hypothetical protein
MIYFIYAIYDRISCTYTEPHLEYNDGCAQRWFESILNGSKFRHSDFDLVKLGKYNVNTGALVPRS